MGVSVEIVVIRHLYGLVRRVRTDGAEVGGIFNLVGYFQSLIWKEKTKKFGSTDIFAQTYVRDHISQ